MKTTVVLLSLALTAGSGLLAQEHAEHKDHVAQRTSPEVTKPAGEAVAVLHPLGDSKVSGVVRFTESSDGVKVTADIKGLPPNSTHGLHIHEFGDCSSADGMSAGGHYNPEGHQHAAPDAEQRHAGDLGNVRSDENGNAKLDLTVKGVSINGEKNPIVGRSVILHQKADDLKSQPTGDAGGRIACGVIGLSKGK